MTTLLQTRTANQIAQRFFNDACREKHGHLTRAASYALWAVEALRDAGLPEHRKIGELGVDVADVVALAIDALNEAHGQITKDADNAGIAPEEFPLDVTELLEMHRQLGGK